MRLPEKAILRDLNSVDGLWRTVRTVVRTGKLCPASVRSYVTSLRTLSTLALLFCAAFKKERAAQLTEHRVREGIKLQYVARYFG